MKPLSLGLLNKWTCTWPGYALINGRSNDAVEVGPGRVERLWSRTIVTCKEGCLLRALANAVSYTQRQNHRYLFLERSYEGSVFRSNV